MGVFPPLDQILLPGECIQQPAKPRIECGTGNEGTIYVTGVVVMASGTQSGVTQGAEVEPRKVEQAEAPLLVSNIDVLNRICGEG